MVAKAQGAGISLRREHYEAILTNQRRLDWIECNPENFMETGLWPRKVIEHASANYPTFAHGVATSVGGPDPFRDDYFRILKSLLDTMNCEYFSDHCCYASAGGVEFHDLLPMPFTDEAVRWIGKRAKEVEDRLERPFVLENISYYAHMPTTNMNESQFCTAVLDEYDGGMLLDVNNIYVNSINMKLDPYEILRGMPIHRVKHIHLAGHRVFEDMVLDDHGSAVIPPVWALYREAIKLAGRFVPTMIEWENNPPSWDRLLDEADSARRNAEEALAELAASKEAAAPGAPPREATSAAIGVTP
jgi:hypothetical protein